MAVSWQQVPVSFSKGVDTKADPKQLEAGRLVYMQNGSFQSPRMIMKRNGYSVFSTNTYSFGSLTSLSVISTFEDNLVIFDGRNAYTYYPTSNLWYLAQPPTQVAKAYSTSLQINEIFSSPTVAALVYDSATDGVTTFFCYAIATAVNVYSTYYSIIDNATNVPIVSSNLIISGTLSVLGIKIVAIDGKYLVFRNEFAAGNIGIYSFSASAPYSYSTGTPITAVNNAGFDTCLFTVGGNSFAGVIYTTGGNTNVATYNSSMTLAGNATLQAHIGQYMTIVADNSNGKGYAHSIYKDGAGSQQPAYAFSFNVSSSGAISSINSNNIANFPYVSGNDMVGRSSIVLYNSNLYIVTQRSYKPSSDTFVWPSVGVTVLNTSLAVVTSYTDMQYSCALAGKAVSLNGQPPCVLVRFVSHDQLTAFQGGYYLVTISTTNSSQIISKFGSPNGPDYITPNYECLTEASVSGNSVSYAATIQPDKRTYSLLYANTNFSPSYAPQTVELGNTLHLSGGCLTGYDGNTIFDHGFSAYPIAYKLAAGGSGSLSIGSYSYILVWQWLDKYGQIHYSAPSVAKSINVGSASQKVTVEYCNLTLNNKQNVRVLLYGTVANGSVYYYKASTLNNPTTPFSTIDDLTSDSNAVQSALIYTATSAANAPTPAIAAMCSYRARMILIPADDPYSWWFSKKVLPQSAATRPTPVEFSDLFINTVDSTGGPLTACIQMDDKLIFFRTNGISYTVGDGPSDNGSNSDYADAQAITSPVGCENPNSLVLMPDGVMFQASNSSGIWLLTRGLQVTYIGADIESANGTDVTSAVLVDNQNQVRFTFGFGNCIVYDYYNKDQNGVGQWYVFSNNYAVSATMFGGKYTWGKSDGTVYQEAPGTYADGGFGGSTIQLQVKTGWITFGAIQGFERIKSITILGDYVSSHTLQVDIYYDFNTTIAQSVIVKPSSSAPYQYRVNLARQKCTSIQLLITETDVTSNGGALNLSDITFEVGTKEGTFKLPPTQRFG